MDKQILSHIQISSKEVIKSTCIFSEYLKENVTNLQAENSQLKESIKENEKKLLAMNMVVKDDTQYLLHLLQYNISLLHQKDEDLQTCACGSNIWTCIINYASRQAAHHKKQRKYTFKLMF